MFIKSSVILYDFIISDIRVEEDGEMDPVEGRGASKGGGAGVLSVNGHKL